jgi:hypothetical protein
VESLSLPKFLYRFKNGTLAIFVLIIAILALAVLSSLVNPAWSTLLEPRLKALTLSLVLFCVYLVFGSPRIRPWIFLAEIVVVSVFITIFHEIYMREEWTIIAPYIGILTLAVACAMAAPQISIPSVAVFVVLLVAPLLQAYFWWSPVERASIGIEAPWISAAAVLFSLGIWYYRRKGIELARQRAELIAKGELMKRFAILLLGAQHLMNSPLQTILANVRLIEAEHPGAEGRVKSIDRAFETVQQVGQVISFGEEHIRWEAQNMPNDIEDLTRLVHDLARQLIKKS